MMHDSPGTQHKAPRDEWPGLDTQPRSVAWLRPLAPNRKCFSLAWSTGLPCVEVLWSWCWRGTPALEEIRVYFLWADQMRDVIWAALSDIASITAASTTRCHARCLRMACSYRYVRVHGAYSQRQTTSTT